ncbi:MAG: hypothetical protein IRY95_00905 [Clostridia bacterium]|nr:hypothetical protein [Clostridia bacterium]
MDVLRFSRAVVWVCVACIAAGVAAAAWQVARRVGVEARSRSVEVVVDYENFGRLADEEGRDREAFFRALAEAGVTSVGLPVATVKRLQEAGRVTALTGAAVLDLRRTGRGDGLPPEPVEPRATYIRAGDPELGRWLADAARTYLGPERVDAAGEWLVLRGDVEGVAEWPLGFVPGDVAAASRWGLRVVPRFENAPALTGDAVRAALRGVVDEAPAALRPSTVLFAGDEAFGFPDALADTAAAMRELGLTLAVVEAPDQLGNLNWRGLRQLDELLDHRTVRVFSIPDWVLLRRRPSEVIDTVLRAVEERNVRVVYARPLTRFVDPHRRVEANVLHYGELVRAIERRGFRVGPAEAAPPLAVPPWVSLLGAWAAVAAAALLADRALGWRPTWTLVLLVAGLPAAAGLTLVAPTLGRQAAALVAACIFPSLGVVHALAGWRERPGSPWWAGFRGLLTASAWSAAGAVVIAGVLADSRFLLEWSYFRGVKVSFLVPPALTLLGGLAVYGTGLVAERPGVRAPGWRKLLEELRALGNFPLRGEHLVVLALFLGGLVLYVARSGNASSALVPEMELKLRSWLETVLFARPRTKEFLLGHPAFLVAGLLAARGDRLAALLAAGVASIGQVSLVNSFEHIRTPFVLSAARSVYGLALGIVAGAAAYLACRAVLAGWERWWATRERAS